MDDSDHSRGMIMLFDIRRMNLVVNGFGFGHNPVWCECVRGFVSGEYLLYCIDVLTDLAQFSYT